MNVKRLYVTCGLFQVYYNSSVGGWEMSQTCNAACVLGALLHMCLETRYWVCNLYFIKNLLHTYVMINVYLILLSTWFIV